jgi:hypothetical protein
MLVYLLDEHISPAVATQIRSLEPRMRAETMQAWRGGSMLSADDPAILHAAAVDGLTLVTFDLRTIPPLLMRWADDGLSHAGVVLVHRRTIPAGDIGGLARALVWLWRQAAAADWMDRVEFLRAHD